MQISVEGKLIEAAAGVSCAEVLKQALSGKRFKAALACRVCVLPTRKSCSIFLLKYPPVRWNLRP